ncbi:MAG: hypothetical protein RIM72_19045 [Alphaproteobacteria bacterium]
MRLILKLTGFALAGIFTISVVASAIAHGPDSQGGGQGQMPMMGQGMMGQGYQGQMPMMGHGMMGQGYQGQMPMMGHGMMGQGYQGQMPMMGHGMMGQGYQGQMPMMGHGMMGDYGYGQMQPLRRDLTTDEVKHMMEHRVDWAGNPNLKVGKVMEKDADTIVSEIVTKEGSLVRKIEVDRHTGRMKAVQ